MQNLAYLILATGKRLESANVDFTQAVLNRRLTTVIASSPEELDCRTK